MKEMLIRKIYPTKIGTFLQHTAYRNSHLQALSNLKFNIIFQLHYHSISDTDIAGIFWCVNSQGEEFQCLRISPLISHLNNQQDIYIDVLCTLSNNLCISGDGLMKTTQVTHDINQSLCHIHLFWSPPCTDIYNYLPLVTKQFKYK